MAETRVFVDRARPLSQINIVPSQFKEPLGRVAVLVLVKQYLWWSHRQLFIHAFMTFRACSEPV